MQEHPEKFVLAIRSLIENVSVSIAMEQITPKCSGLKQLHFLSLTRYLWISLVVPLIWVELYRSQLGSCVSCQPVGWLEASRSRMICAGRRLSFHVSLICLQRSSRVCPHGSGRGPRKAEMREHFFKTAFCFTFAVVFFCHVTEPRIRLREDHQVKR